jgi:hypothetical protein
LYTKLINWYAKRQQRPITTKRVKMIVAAHKEAATGALAVSYICLIINVF